MRPLVVVVFHPVRQTLPRLFKSLEPRPVQILLLQRLPEPLDLPQCHRMMRGTADVMDVVLFQFLLELRHAPPARVLPPVVRQHLLRDAERPRGHAVRLHHIFTGLAPVQPQRRDVAGVVIDEPDDIGHLAQNRVVGDVRLPHLVRHRRLEASRGRLGFAAGFGFRQNTIGGLQLPAHRLRARLQKEEPLQHLRDPPGPLAGIAALQLRDLLLDRLRQPGFPALPRRTPQSFFSILLVTLRPVVDGCS